MNSISASGARSELPSPLDAECFLIDGPCGPIAVYVSGPVQAEPLLLIHSINAAASAFEVRPLFEHYRMSRRVYAFDLPGFGKSERSDRVYGIRMMTDAVHMVANHIRSRDGGQGLDGIALSLSCEFLARAASETPEAYRSLGFISPTGFETGARDKAPGNRGQSWLLNILNVRWWRASAFRLFTRRKVIRAFLKKTWGSENIDQTLLDYDCRSVQQPGAEHAPYYFIAGFLFSTDILRVYDLLRLPIWMAHGVRGDFVNYRYKDRIAGKQNWTIEVFDSGAFPHFEILDSVVRSYDAFATSTTGAKQQSENATSAVSM